MKFKRKNRVKSDYFDLDVTKKYTEINDVKDMGQGTRPPPAHAHFGLFTFDAL